MESINKHEQTAFNCKVVNEAFAGVTEYYEENKEKLNIIPSVLALL